MCTPVGTHDKSRQAAAGMSHSGSADAGNRRETKLGSDRLRGEEVVPHRTVVEGRGSRGGHLPGGGTKRLTLPPLRFDAPSREE